MLDFLKRLFRESHYVDLPLYSWTEGQLNCILGYEWVKIKFYATKNWVEFYAYRFGNNDNVDRFEKRFIIPRNRVKNYDEWIINIERVRNQDHARYGGWHKK